MPVRPLPPLLAEKAKKELFEDPNRLEADLQHLKDWIAKQPYLNACTDDQWLVAFLRGCKFSLERAKQKLDMYYTVRGTAPELFKFKHTDPIFEEILDTGSFLILPKTASPDSPRVMMIRPGMQDPDKYNISDVISVSTLVEKITFLEDDNAMVAGTETILDLDGVTMGHFLQMTPSMIKKMVVAGQDAIPFRMKGTHYLNTPPGFETIFNAIKALLNEKNKSRLYVHNKDMESLYKSIPKEILPKEYGGDAGTTKEIIADMKRKVKEYHAFLDEDYKRGTDESKRPGKPRTTESMFGVEGSFRQLQLD